MHAFERQKCSTSRLMITEGASGVVFKISAAVLLLRGVECLSEGSGQQHIFDLFRRSKKTEPAYFGS